MEVNKILNAELLDIVFEGRNKDYGAYYLRKTYHQRIRYALLVTVSIAALILLISFLNQTLNNRSESKVKINEMTLQDVKQEEKNEPPPPPPPPPPKQEPPKVEMKQFTPPVIKKDEEVEKPPPPQEELKEAKIDVVNVEGIKDEGLAAPVDIDQGKQIIEEKVDENKIFDKVEIEAAFPGGDTKWRQYLERNANGQVATDNGAPEGTYTTVVQFVVDKEGNISDVRALTNHGYGMEEEAMRVIRKGPKWSPAIQNGRQVKAYRKQPITFRVESE